MANEKKEVIRIKESELVALIEGVVKGVKDETIAESTTPKELSIEERLQRLEAKILK